MGKKNLIKHSAVWLPIMLIMFLVISGCSGGGKKDKKEGPKAPVEITSAAPTEEPEEGTNEPVEESTPTPITGKFERRTDRDPFMPVTEGGEFFDEGEDVAWEPGDEPEEPGDEPEEPGEPGKEPEKPKETAIPAEPDDFVVPAEPTSTEPSEQVIDSGTAGVTVTGIMKVDGGYQAILTSSSGKNFLVGVGQSVGEWKVSSITKKQVVLKAKGYVAKLDLPDDLKAPEGSSKSPGKEEGPKVPGG